MDLAVGDTVALSDGRIALVQYIGPAAFALGEWIGCSLSERTGKNGSPTGFRKHIIAN
jgi:dynactin 1